MEKTPFQTSFRRNLQSIQIILGFLFLTIFFQNCTLSNDVLFQGNFIFPQSKIESTSSGGNGGGYEGKLTGIYARHIPDYECQGKAAPHSYIQFKDDKAYLIQNSVEKCQSSQKEIPISTILSFSTDPDLIAIKDGLYQKTSSDNIFENVTLPRTKVFCTSLEDSAKVRVRLSVPASANSSLDGEILDLSTLEKTIISSISEKLFMQQLTYSQDQFQLNIDARTVDLVDFIQGRFPAKLQWKSKKSDSVLDIQTKMMCRLALNFDGIVWPSRPLHLSSVLSWTFGESLSEVFMGLPDHQISVRNLDSEKEVANLSFENSKTASKAISMKYLKSNNSVLIQTISDEIGNQDLWSWNIHDSQAQQLNSFGTTTSEFLQDPVTGKILFLEGRLPGPFQSHDADFYLRTNSLNGDNYHVVQTSDSDFQNHLNNLFVNPLSNFSTSASRWLRQSNPQVDQNQANVHVNFAESLYLRQHLSPVDQKTILHPFYQPELLFSTLNPLLNLNSLLSISLKTLAVAESLRPLTKSGWILSSSVQGNAWNSTGSIHTQSSFQLPSENKQWTVVDMKKMFLSPDETKILYSIPDPSNNGYDQLILSDIQHQSFQRIDRPGSFQSDFPFGFYANGDIYFVQFAANSLSFVQILQKIGNSPSFEIFGNHLLPTDNMKKFTISKNNEFIIFIADRNHDAVQEIYIDYIHGPGVFQMNNRFDEYGSVQDFHLLSQGIFIETLNLSWERHLFLWKLQ